MSRFLKFQQLEIIKLEPNSIMRYTVNTQHMDAGPIYSLRGMYPKSHQG